MTETIGAAIAVHRELGPGFMETIYHRAMLIELQSRRLTYESERPIKVVYRGVEIPGQRIDLIVERLSSLWKSKRLLALTGFTTPS